MDKYKEDSVEALVQGMVDSVLDLRASLMALDGYNQKLSYMAAYGYVFESVILGMQYDHSVFEHNLVYQHRVEDAFAKATEALRLCFQYDHYALYLELAIAHLKTAIFSVLTYDCLAGDFVTGELARLNVPVSLDEGE